MKNKELRLEQSTVIKAVETTSEGVLTIRGIASMYRTSDGLLQVDRDNELMNLDFMDLESYKKNPILVFQHDWQRPMGKVVSLEHRDGALHFTAEVYKLTGEENIYEAVQKGIVKSVSISVVPHEFIYRNGVEPDTDILEIARSTLVEISLTTVQSNQEALFDVVAEKSPTISRKSLAMQNGMTCDELTGSCAFKSEIKEKSPNKEKEDKMNVKNKDVETPVAPAAAETPTEPVIEEKPAVAVETPATPVVEEPTAQVKPFDEKALVDAIVEAGEKSAQLKTEKEEEAANAEAEAEANAKAEKEALVESSKAYIKDQAAKIIGIPDADFDPDLAEEFYGLVSDAAEAIEAKVAGIVKPSQPE